MSKEITGQDMIKHLEDKGYSKFLVIGVKEIEGDNEGLHTVRMANLLDTEPMFMRAILSMIEEIANEVKEG